MHLPCRAITMIFPPLQLMDDGVFSFSARMGRRNISCPSHAAQDNTLNVLSRRTESLIPQQLKPIPLKLD
jgi:hypothetical protein